MNKQNFSWFDEARYGLFIHWGAYSAGARGEWVMNRERIPVEAYRRDFVSRFGAEDYDPADWAAKARRWGMRYAVVTTRHHDGFSLWDSTANPYNARNYGPGRDLVRPFVEAFREAGLNVGFYYSPANWASPDYPGPFYRDWPGKEDWRDESSRRRFVAQYRAELEELCTRYGKIDYLWFDGCIPENIDGEETLGMIRAWQPGIAVNNRLGAPFDIRVCEQTINPPKEGGRWEACMTLNANWGYHAGDDRWKTPWDVIELLLTCAQKGGNLLLNVGPRADGAIPEESVRILDEVGEWLRANEASVRASDLSPFSWNNTARPITVKGNHVYLHFLVNPLGSFRWAELSNRVVSARWLDDGSSVHFEQSDGILVLRDLRWSAPGRTVELEVEGVPEPITRQTTFWIPE